MAKYARFFFLAAILFNRFTHIVIPGKGPMEYPKNIGIGYGETETAAKEAAAEAAYLHLAEKFTELKSIVPLRA